MLAIVIPYYKHTFFEATLFSLQNQTNKQFNVYIGDDASPENPIALLEKYKNAFTFQYSRYDSNLGGISLTQQWERCLRLCKDEEWVMFLCDDDVLGENCIASFYEDLEKITSSKSDVVRFASKVINGASNSVSGVYNHPEIEKATDFLERKLKGGTRSSLSEYVFRKDLVSQIGFKDFALAWFSDILAVLEFSKFENIFTINSAVVYFRLSTINITSRNDDLIIKERATFSFYYYLLIQYYKIFPSSLVNILFDKIEKRVLEDKKNKKNIIKMIYLYFFYFKLKRFFYFILNFVKSII